MSNEKHMETKIQMFEDMLLRSKNTYEIENINKELRKMRIDLQKSKWSKQRGSLIN